MNSDHVLVCLSSSPANERIIRIAAAMAKAFSASFTALYVENQNVQLSRENLHRLEKHMELAKHFGAGIERVYGTDIAYEIAEFARLRSVTKLVIGKSASGVRRIFKRRTLTDQLLYFAPNLEIHIIPDSILQTDYRITLGKHSPKFKIHDVLKSIGLICAASLIGISLELIGVTSIGILPVYILAVLVTTIITNGYEYWLFASFAAVFGYNFLFVEPRYTFLSYDADYPITFLIMLIVSVIGGNMTARLKRAAQEAEKAAHRTKLIFDTDRMLSQINEPVKIIEITARQIAYLTARDVVYYMKQGDQLSDPTIIRGIGDRHVVDFLAPEELEAAEWTAKQTQGSTMQIDTSLSANASYFAIRMNDTVYGVIGSEPEGSASDAYENSILISILGECALALENARNASEKEEANIRAKNEQLRANLLRSISHDIRTPLTTIKGNADSLLRYELTDEVRNGIYTDIYEDSIWLNDLVENLLAISKIDDEHIKQNMTVDVLEDVIAEAIRHIDHKNLRHKITIHNDEKPAIVRMDTHLMVQVVFNLINNAIKYTPDGSEIDILSVIKGDFVHVEVRDNGPGIDEQDMVHVFEMFYTGKKRSSDSRRGLGLGLALCKSIIEIHGGMIEVQRNSSRGTSICFTLPIEKVSEHE